jgi:DNA-binding IscR family transcriptional regulator
MVPAQKAKDVTVHDPRTLECTEGSIELVFCVGEDSGGESCGALQREMEDQCAPSPMSKEIGDDIADVFRRTTIRDLCQRAEEMGIERPLDVRFMYYT